MDKWIAAAKVVIPIFAAVFLGIFSRRKGLFSPEESRGLQQYVMKFGIPCMLFNSTLTASMGAESLTSMALLLPFMAVSTFCGFYVRKKKLHYHNFPMLFAAQESGMLGIPLFIALFGTAQAYRMGVLDLTQAIIAIPVISLLAADPGENLSPLALAGKVISSPLLILSALGLVLNLSGAAAWLEEIGVLGILSETTAFLAQPVSAVMLFCVGCSFSLAGKDRNLIIKISIVHFLAFAVAGLIIQGILLLLPQVDPMTRWAVLLYTTLPGSYIAPTLARTEEEGTLAAGVCSLLTVSCLAVFCAVAVVTA